MSVQYSVHAQHTVKFPLNSLSYRWKVPGFAVSKPGTALEGSTTFEEIVPRSLPPESMLFFKTVFTGVTHDSFDIQGGVKIGFSRITRKRSPDEEKCDGMFRQESDFLAQKKAPRPSDLGNFEDSADDFRENFRIRQDFIFLREQRDATIRRNSEIEPSDPFFLSSAAFML